MNEVPKIVRRYNAIGWYFPELPPPPSLSSPPPTLILTIGSLINLFATRYISFQARPIASRTTSYANVFRKQIRNISRIRISQKLVICNHSRRREIYPCKTDIASSGALRRQVRGDELFSEGRSIEKLRTGRIRLGSFSLRARGAPTKFPAAQGITYSRRRMSRASSSSKWSVCNSLRA